MSQQWEFWQQHMPAGLDDSKGQRLQAVQVGDAARKVNLLEDGMRSMGWGIFGGMPCQHHWPCPPL